MKTAVAIYSTHKQAMDAVKTLHAQGYSLKKVSVLGKAEIIEDHIKIDDHHSGQNIPIIVGAAAGPIVGLLSGIGLFAIPGLGVLYGAGAVVGALGGLELGVISGGLLTLFATMGVKDDHAVRFKKHIENGKFVVMMEGHLNEIENAEKILHTEGTHLEFVS